MEPLEPTFLKVKRERATVKKEKKIGEEPTKLPLLLEDWELESKKLEYLSELFKDKYY